MTEQSEIREILQKYENQLRNLFRVGDEFPVKSLEYQNHTCSQISALLVEEMENEIRSLTKDSPYLQYDKGFNHAIGNCQDIVKRECGGKQ
jgi:hypothetical protein